MTTYYMQKSPVHQHRAFLWIVVSETDWYHSGYFNEGERKPIEERSIPDVGSVHMLCREVTCIFHPDAVFQFSKVGICIICSEGKF